VRKACYAAHARSPGPFPPNPVANLQSLQLVLSGADVNVDFDLSVVAQIALFGLFIVVLKPVLFDPLLKLFEEREKLTDGSLSTARDLDAKANELLKRFDSEIESVRHEAAAERDRLRAETAKLEAKMLEEAKADAARILTEGRARIEKEVATLRAELEASRPALAEQIASKMIGREVRS
jgi:F-type H+-transporting ATPase subunit b